MNANVTAAAALAALLLVAAPAQAIYIVTPLTFELSASHAEVGDAIDIGIAPQNESEAANWSGRTVRLYYAYDTAEGAEGPDEPVSDNTFRRVLVTDALTLDAGARGHHRWVVPAEMDDRNVQLLLESEAGDLLAVTDLPVGDAPPIMRVLAGSGAAPEPTEEAPPTTGTPEEPEQEPQQERADREVPAVGLLATLALAALAALVLRRR